MITQKSVPVVNKALDAMYPHRKSRPYFMVICGLVLLGSVIFDKVRPKETESQFTEFKQNVGSGVSGAYIEFGDFPFKRNNMLCKVNMVDDLSTIDSYLRKAELQSQSGHVLPLLEFEMHLEYSSGSTTALMGWIYDIHPNDIYLQWSLWEEQNGEKESYHRAASPPMRIPGAGPWIRQFREKCSTTKPNK